MPVGKKIALAIKRGGDLPRNPQVAREEPPPLGQLPEPPETDSVMVGIVEGLLVTVTACSTKTNGRGKYFSYMVKARDRTTIWWSAGPDTEEVPRGTDVRITGLMGAPFGEKGNIHPIRKVRKIAIASTPKTPEVEEAKVSSPVTDNLLQRVSALLSEFGQAKVLRALAEATE